MYFLSFIPNLKERDERKREGRREKGEREIIIDKEVG